MSVISPPRPRSIATIVVTSLLAGAVISSIPITSTPATAMPGECRLETRWQSGGGHYDPDTDTYIEVGITPDNRWVCDAVSPPVGGDPSSGGSDPGAPAPDPAPTRPPAPGPVSPASPTSTPAGAAPPCVAGANNDPKPGTGWTGATGDGSVVLQNMQELIEGDNLRIESTTPSRIVSVYVNTGATQNEARENPVEGMTPEQAASSMYWYGMDEPIFSEAGPVTATAKVIVKLLMQARRGNAGARIAAESMIRQGDSGLVQAVRDELFEVFKRSVTMYKDLPPGVKRALDEMYDILDNIIRTTPIDGSDPDVAALYAAVTKQPAVTGAKAGGSACGQINHVKVESAAGTMGLTDDDGWIKITYAGTTNGTLINRIKALSTPELSCPPVSVNAVRGGQVNRMLLTTGCTGTVTGARLLTLGEILSLSPEDQFALYSGLSAEMGLGAVALRKFNEWGLPPTDARSLVGAPSIHFDGTGADGGLTYTSTSSAPEDFLVVAAKDSSGVEHPFLVRVELKDPPACTSEDRRVGPYEHRWEPVLKGGSIQVIRNQSFTIDPKLLCDTDYRNTYRVLMNVGIEGTTPTANDDGTITFDWVDPDLVGAHRGGLTVTAWDETSGAPSPETTFPVDVRDVSAVCNDVEVDYDMSDLKGAPIEIPVSCGMVGGLEVLSAPFLRIDDSERDGYERKVPGGVFRSDGTTVTFTPSATPEELSTIQMSPWSTDPMKPSPLAPVHGQSYSVDVRISE